MTRLRHRRRCVGIAAGLLLCLIALTGCEGGTDQYVVWPQAARTGDTVAILFNTEWDTESSPEGALLDASVDNILIQLSDSSEWTEAVSPRAVIEVPASPGSLLMGAELASHTGVVALFDIPDPWPNGGISFPDEFHVVVEQDGIATFGDNELTILGPGGSPLVFDLGTSDETELSMRPMLRLRPAWDGATQEGFNPAWEIGALEFTLRFTPPPAGEVANVTALGNGEAASALTMTEELDPQGGDKLWRVVLVHPQGFTLPAKGCIGSDCYSGRWSLLDLPLEKYSGGLALGEPIFFPDDFAIEDLKVIDLDGEQLNPPYSGETFFHIYAMRNLVEPNTPVPEPGALLLLAAGVLGLCVLHEARRRRWRP